MTQKAFICPPVRKAGNSRPVVNLSLANLLLSPQLPSPPIGVGRIHRLADDETQLPNEDRRSHEYVEGVRADFHCTILNRRKSTD